MSAIKKRRVNLYGHLAEGIGPQISLAFDTPAKAVRLLDLNFPGFIERFREGYYRVVCLRSDGSERILSEQGLHTGFTGDLAIIPETKGAQRGNQRKGMIGLILGAVIIGAAFFFSGGSLAGALPGFLGEAGLTFGSIARLGAGLALNGLSSLLTATPKTDYDDVEERRSFVFNGPVNLTQPGGVVPVIYGRMMVGTYTVSTALDTELLGRNGSGVRTTEVVIREAGDAPSVDLDDLIANPSIVQQSPQSVGGVSLGTPPQTVTVGDIQVDYALNGDRTDILTFSYVGAGDPADLQEKHVINYEMPGGIEPLPGRVIVWIGSRDEEAPGFGATYVDGVEVTGE